jgi:hypothetical protein
MHKGGNWVIASNFRGLAMVALLETINPKRHLDIHKICICVDSSEFNNGNILQRQDIVVKGVAPSYANGH